jgi:hypothetical protein
VTTLFRVEEVVVARGNAAKEFVVCSPGKMPFIRRIVLGVEVLENRASSHPRLDYRAKHSRFLGMSGHGRSDFAMQRAQDQATLSDLGNSVVRGVDDLPRNAVAKSSSSLKYVVQGFSVHTVGKAAHVLKQKRTWTNVFEHPQIATDGFCRNGIVKSPRLLSSIKATLGKCRARRTAYKEVHLALP